MELKLFILIFIINISISIETNSTTTYDPEALLLRIFNFNNTVLPRQGGYDIKFEDDFQNNPDDDQGQYGLINIKDNGPHRFQERPQDFNPDSNGDEPLKLNSNRPLRFEDTDSENPVFQDDNGIQQNKRQRKRRRKPKAYPGLGSRPPGPQGYGYGYGYGNPGYQGAPIRRPRRPRPSLASEAMSAVTGALASIARYDDYQCVPRLLCEAAGGGALASGGILDTVAGIQPLLTLLSAYNGISTSPLFVFGRAVFLGMTSKNNPGTCRYAYAQCPTDPEQLIYYLNNYNGGFFRFFNAGPNQSLQQFYQHLGQNGLDPSLYQQGQSGLYQQQLGQSGLYQQQYGQSSLYQQNLDQNGLYQSGYQQGSINPIYGQGYVPSQNVNGPFSNQDPYRGQPQSLYNKRNVGQNYALNYNNYGNKIRFRDAKEIEKRIQNKPIQEYDDYNDVVDDNDDIINYNSDIIYEDSNVDNHNSKWAFPENLPSNNNERQIKSLKFPEEVSQIEFQSTRKGKGINFPNNNPNKKPVKYYNYNYLNNFASTSNNGEQNNNRPSYQNFDYQSSNKVYFNNHGQNQNSYNSPNNNKQNYNNHNYKQSYSNYNYQNGNNKVNNNNYAQNYNKPFTYGSGNTNQNFNNQDYYFDYNNNFYVKKENQKVNNNFDDGSKIVYVVRGNGDPNHPEIVKVRPGESVY